jgi:hypothetical protein
MFFSDNEFVKSKCEGLRKIYRIEILVILTQFEIAVFCFGLNMEPKDVDIAPRFNSDVAVCYWYKAVFTMRDNKKCLNFMLFSSHFVISSREY